MLRSPKSFIHSDFTWNTLVKIHQMTQRMNLSSFGQYFVFLGYIVWGPLTLKVGSRSLEHLCLQSRITSVSNLIKVARFHRLVHRIECKEEATPFTSEVLVSTAKCFLSPLSGGWHYCTISFWAKSREFVSSSIPSWKIFTAHAQPFRGARDLAFCLKVPLDSLLVWASSGGSGETARMRRLPLTFAARIGDKYQIRLVQPI